MMKRKLRFEDAWQAYVPDGWEEDGDVLTLADGHAEITWSKPHCDYCAIARKHPSTCFCGNCSIAAQHGADRAKADRLGALGMGW